MPCRATRITPWLARSPRTASSWLPAAVMVRFICGRRPVARRCAGSPSAFSPDGKILAVASYKPLSPGKGGPAGGGGDPRQVEAICLEELATGKQLLRIETGPVGLGLLAFSADGRVLATADKEALHLW